ncbi:hypothetical protein Rsub_10602 [Raphidocelis subcapitata]|uniref:MYND-type domain-containing protein n=1 Tax=Raphidocelis subcapitata TaxID=307507 RepID=A0A2V0PEI8_9CHLO|nr:hypothetical protein Rsub_10602 [Raphidocelis subcapitata]|eukprot:GBF97929.1 hypothetical protein Rsub_10602 [Raphidocelis subcapitata]
MGNVQSLSAEEVEQVLRASPPGLAVAQVFRAENATVSLEVLQRTPSQGQQPRRPLRRLLCAVRSLTSGDWRPSHAAVRDVFMEIAAHGEHSDRRAWAEAALEAPLPLLARAVERLLAAAAAAEAGGELDASAAEALSAALGALSGAVQRLIPFQKDLQDSDELEAEERAAAQHAQQLVECGWLSTAAGLLAGALAERRGGGASRSALLQLPPGTGPMLGQIIPVCSNLIVRLDYLPPGHELRRVVAEALTDSDFPALAVEAAWEFRGEGREMGYAAWHPLAILQNWVEAAASDGGPAAGGWFGRRAAITARLEVLAPTLRQLLALVLSNTCAAARIAARGGPGRTFVSVEPAPHGPLVQHLPPLPPRGPKWIPIDYCAPLYAAVDTAQWLVTAAGVDLVTDSAAWLLLFEACLHVSQMGRWTTRQQWQAESWFLYEQTAVELLARLPPRDAAAAAAALEPLLVADLAGGLLTAHLLAHAHAVLLPDRLVAAALPAVEARVRAAARRSGGGGGSGDGGGGDAQLLGTGVALLWAFTQRATGPAAGSAASGPAVTALKALRVLSHLGHAAGALEAAQSFGRERGRLDPAFQAAFDVRLEELRARRPLGGGSAAGSQGEPRAPAAAPAPTASQAPALLLPPGLLPACANPDCSNLEGPSEAALPTKRCRGCLTVRYCGAACQTADWPQHRARCKELRTAGAAAAAPSGASGSGGAAAE